MGRIAKQELQSAYVKTSTDADRNEMKERNDCAVIAFSVVTGKSYADSHALLKKNGRKDRKDTYRETTCAALQEAGFRYRKWGFIKMQQMIKSYPGVHGQFLKNITTHHPVRFAEQWGKELKGKTLLFRTKTHILAVKDGKVQDWTQNRAMRVIEILEVERI